VSAQSEDVGALKWQKAELESRNEMYQAQLMKAQMALERSDQDKAKLEQDLGAALAATAAGDKSVRLAAVSDCTRRGYVSPVTWVVSERRELMPCCHPVAESIASAAPRHCSFRQIQMHFPTFLGQQKMGSPHSSLSSAQTQCARSSPTSLVTSMTALAQTLVTMRERLAGLLNRRSAREEETDEKLKETASALQAAYRERQVPIPFLLPSFLPHPRRCTDRREACGPPLMG